MINVKEQIWFRDVKYLRLSHFMGIIHVCSVVEAIGINKENKMSTKQEIHKWSLMINN